MHRTDCWNEYEPTGWKRTHQAYAEILIFTTKAESFIEFANLDQRLTKKRHVRARERVDLAARQFF